MYAWMFILTYSAITGVSWNRLSGPDTTISLNSTVSFYKNLLDVKYPNNKCEKTSAVSIHWKFETHMLAFISIVFLAKKIHWKKNMRTNMFTNSLKEVYVSAQVWPLLVAKKKSQLLTTLWLTSVLQNSKDAELRLTLHINAESVLNT